MNPIIELIIYSDPYCTWCWGSEPVLRKIQEVYGDQVRLVYRMGGLVEDTTRFRDPLNKIGGPGMHKQVAEHWRQAATRHGMPVDADVFIDYASEFRSTWPACIAYKAAEIQDPVLAGRYLRRLREAAAAEHVPIHRLEVQADLAEETGLDRQRLLADIDSGIAEAAFRDDLQLCRDNEVTGFPSYEVHVPGGEEVAMFGFHNFTTFESTFKRLAGDRLTPREIVADDESIVGFAHKYGKVAPREVSEVFTLNMSEARERLDRLTSEGRLKKQKAGSGFFYLA
ncbi:MAG: DsbA family protein [Thermoleophilia bacterium]|nr:DsbA family protein [Thermoleophilia bacterium]